MTWLLPAVIAHLGNALVFVVDKSLLSAKQVITKPLSYALYSAVTAGAVAVALPFFWAPLSTFVGVVALLAALLRIGALWSFFAALKTEEPSRVVPLTGSIVALASIPLGSWVLGEQLSGLQAVAIGLLIIGGLLLSITWRRRRIASIRGVSLMLTAGVLFAGNFVVSKYLYDQSSVFVSSFIYLRLIEAATAGVGLIIVWLYRGRPTLRRRSTASRAKRRGLVTSIFISNKVLAAGAFILQQYAISLGQVSVVNALQGLQYVFLLVLAIVISRWWPHLFKEELKRVVLWQKIAGITCCTVGVGLLL